MDMSKYTRKCTGCDAMIDPIWGHWECDQCRGVVKIVRNDDGEIISITVINSGSGYTGGDSKLQG